MIKARILVIEDEAELRAVLAEGLRTKGHAVFLARDGSEGIRVFRREKPDIVLTDVQMPGQKGIDVLGQIRTIEPEAKVVIMTGYGSEETAIEALRGGAVNYLKKPFTLRDVCEVIDKIASIQTREISKEFLLEETKRLVMGNQIEKVWGVVNQLLMNAESVCGREKTQELGLGLYEIILNAIEHGSLEITFEEKCRAMETNSYEDLLRERLEDPVCARRRVTIGYRMVPGALHYWVMDEGRGFDWRSLADPDRLKSLLAPCGRGIPPSQSA
jgi:DNA-binding response OmpR family regulator